MRRRRLLIGGAAGAALAAGVMAFPLVVRAVRLGIESVDRHVEELEVADAGACAAGLGVADAELPIVIPAPALHATVVQ